MSSSNRGAGSWPSLSHAKESEREGRNEVLRRERSSVSAVTVIRRVNDERDVVSEHFMHIKDDTRVRGPAEWVATGNRKKDRSRGREELNGGRSGVG